MVSDTPVGMIGLGLMGTALSQRLLATGFAVLGFDIGERCRRPLPQQRRRGL
jgi:3-hydroxyisobutyrate dehydrogenase-like beta-hydroxyacid dehydrogenase